jgi:CRISPR-associated protein Cas1
MPTACVNQPDCRIRLCSERLEVYGCLPDAAGESLLREIPIRDLERLILVESVQISSSALAALLRANIPVNLLAWNGRFLGAFQPATPAHGLARLRQYQRTLDPAFALDIARTVIAAKLYNQRRVLQRLAASRSASATRHPSDPPAPSIPSDPPAPPTPSALSATQPTLAWLDTFFDSILRAGSLDELRGHEGAATARYFTAWAAFLPPEFPFERRSTRPPLNPVNACISFGATLLYAETAAAIHAHGLDPALGLLHATEDGRWSLALDLMEPFRPVLVEALALDLFSHQILNAEHFDRRDQGVYLNEDGRKKFFLQYERRMERQFLSEAVAHRTSLRQQLENQAVTFKASLEQPGALQPFRMN